MSNSLFYFLTLISMSVSCFLTLIAASAADPIISTSGTPIVLYSWMNNRCADGFIPDAPARLFRRKDNKIALIAAHQLNWQLIGNDFFSLKPSCQVILDSNMLRGQNLGHVWIEATYTIDGRNIDALLSEDRSALIRASGCEPSSIRGRCWVNNIISARSSDMGLNYFVDSVANRTVASLGNDYPKQSRTRHGFFTTSNIFKLGEWLYTFAFVESDGFPQRGNCLLRKSARLASGDWRAWGGSDFDVDLSDSNQIRKCSPISPEILGHEIRSVSYHPKTSSWLAVFASRLKLHGDTNAVSGAYYAVSKDLFKWNSAKRITYLPTVPREDNINYFVSYPVLVDPHSLSQNFESIDSSSPVLLYTVQHLSRGMGTMNRDLVYLPLVIE